MSGAHRAPMQQTRSGIVVAAAEGGYRVTYMHTDVPGLALQFAEQPEEVRAKLAAFASAAGGDYLELTDPTRGEAVYLRRELVPHILTVGPAYLQKVHPRLQ